MRAVLADHVRVLGPDHPDTLATRISLADWQGALGRVDEAVSQCERLLADQIRVLGPDHRDTLNTRSLLAYWLGRAGQVGEAVNQFERLLADHLRVLGPDHRDTLNTRINVAYWLGAAGQVDEAISQFERLLGDQIRVLGPGHRMNLHTRLNLAIWLGAAGRLDEAISQSKRLLADNVRVLGPTTPAPSTPGATWPTAWVRQASWTRPSARPSGCWPTRSGCSAQPPRHRGHPQQPGPVERLAQRTSNARPPLNWRACGYDGVEWDQRNRPSQDQRQGRSQPNITVAPCGHSRPRSPCQPDWPVACPTHNLASEITW